MITRPSTNADRQRAEEAEKKRREQAADKIKWNPKYFYDENNWDLVDGKVSFRSNGTRIPWTEIKTSSIENAGNGLFAARKFNQTNIIGFYSGIDVTTSDDLRDDEDTSYQMTLVNKIVDAHPVLCGDAFKHKGWVHMMNDARNTKSYNVYITERGFVRASRDIERGDELFLNYGMKYWLWEPVNLLENLYISFDASSFITMKTDYPTERLRENAEVE